MGIKEDPDALHEHSKVMTTKALGGSLEPQDKLDSTHIRAV